MTSLLRIFVLLFITCAIAQDCRPPAGIVDTYHSGMCNCWSGYAPSTSQSLDCNVHPKCAQLLPGAPDSTGSNNPIRPTYWFSNDNLEILQQVPIVLNRKATWIEFAIPPGFTSPNEPLQTCQYPGILWNKTVNTLDCIDEYRGSIPWTQHQVCGFVLNTNQSNNLTSVYVSTLVTSYIDTFWQNGVSFQRSSSTAYLISVSFATRLTLSATTFTVSITDPNASNLLSMVVVSNSVFDPTTGNTLVSFITTALWPYQLSENATILTTAFVGVSPSNPELQLALSYVESGLPCDNKQRSSCSQKWLATISATGNCVDDIAGAYTLQDDLICRDTINGVLACPGATAPSIDFVLNIGTTHLCPVAAVETNNLDVYQITPYSDPAYSISSSQFQTGDMIYWTFTIVNPLVSIKSITFNTIEMTSSSSPATDVLYSIETGGVTNEGVNVGLSFAEAEFVSAGNTGLLTFSYQLLRSALPNTVGLLQPDNLEVEISTTVIADIQYYGNGKRSVLLDLSNMEVMSAATDTSSIRVLAGTHVENEVSGTVTPSSPSSAVSVHVCGFLVSVIAFCALMF